MSEIDKAANIEDDQLNNSDCVTMVDVLRQEKELEEESAAVLGGSDEKCCTYSKGYIKRQALYSCLTCAREKKDKNVDTTVDKQLDSEEEAEKSFGICLACSYQCHENHELVELYTKRNFRCDCPTIRNKGKKCTFAEPSLDKFEENSENFYNQNFDGLYCTCKRPYPDLEDSVQDEMIQCIMCEDWYHTRHLDTIIPGSQQFSEMICGSCMHVYSFLRDYAGLAVNKVDSTNEDTKVVITEDDENLKTVLDQSISDIMNMNQGVSKPVEQDPNSATCSSSSSSEPSSKRIKLNEEVKRCKRPILGSSYKKGGVFWPDSWRQAICSCTTCAKMYEIQKASFLLDPEDTVQYYEENGLKKARESDYDRGIRALSSMDRVQQIDAITEYNKMKEKLKEYLHSFVVNQKVVTEEDINSFFQNMKNEKNANLGQPYFCR